MMTASYLETINMIPAKPFYMIRHGQTEANRDLILQGQMDSPLTTLGREQALSDE